MANDNWQLKAVLSAVDRMSPVLKQVAAQAKTTRKYLSDVASSAMHTAGAIGLPIGLIGGALSALSVAGAKRAVMAIAELGDVTVKSAQRIGISTDEYQRLNYVASQSGVSAEELGSSMGRLNKSIALAVAGKNKDLAALFTRAGISMRGANGEMRSGAELLPEVADLFARNGNAATQARMGNAIFGKSWQSLAPLLQGGSDGIQQLTDRYKQLGLGMSNADLRAGEAFGDQLDDLRASTSMYANVIGAKLLPKLAPLIERVIGWSVANRDLITTKVSGFVLGMVDAMEKIDWQAMIDGVSSTIDSARSFISWIGGARNALLALVVVMNAQVIVSMATLVAALGRAGFAFLAMAARAYIASNASLLSMARIAVVAVATAGPIGALGAAFTWMAGLAAGAGGIVSGAMALASGAIRAVGVAIMANPLGLVLALATAAFLIYQNWDTLKAWFTGFFDWIGGKFKAIVGWAVDLAKATAGFFGVGSSESDRPSSQPALPAYAGDAARNLAAPSSAPGRPGVPLAMPAYAGDVARGLIAPAGDAPGAPIAATQSRQSLVGPKAGKLEAALKVDFNNMPQGARVEQTQGKGDMPIKFNVGYSSAALGGAF